MRTVILSDIIELTGGGTPKTSKPEFWNGDIPWLSVVDFGGDGRWVDKAEKTITNLGLENSSTKLLKSGDIIISARGTVGELAQLKRPMAFNQSCYGIRARAGVDQDFLYYLLKKSVNDLRRQSHGGVFNTITRSTFDVVSISIPSIVTQKKIANILGSLDEKIELNRRMNETLEQLGQALFRYYFIANPEVKNWPIVKVGDILSELQSGSRPKGGAVELGVPSIGAENIIGLGKYDYSKEKYISEDFFNKLSRGIVNSGDVLLYKDGAYIGKKSLFMNGFPHKKCAVNEHVFILRTNHKLRSQFFMYFWLDQSSITKKIINAGVKAAQPGINQSNVNSLPILLPPEESVKKFDNKISPIMEMIFSNAVESNRLATFRDALLPKLISGEIKI